MIEYKFIIDETLTYNTNTNNSNALVFNLILTGIDLNQTKMAIEIDADNKYCAYIQGTRHIVINKFKKSNQLKKYKNIRLFFFFL